MANIQQITRDYLLRARTEGVAEVTAAAQRLGGATDALAAKTETTTKSQISASAALERQQRQLDLNYRSMKQLESAKRDLDRAQQQGLIGQSRHAELLALANTRYGQAANGSRVFAAATQAANDNLRGFAGNAGVVGAALLALGPWGIAAAAGIAVATLAVRGLATEAGRFADEMGKLRDTAQIIDFTTTQLQALNDKGAEFALTPDKIATGLQRFTAQLEEARRGEGELFTQMQRLDPAMALQFARTRDTASALDLYAQALAKASAAERASLSRAGLGRGGFDIGLMLQSVGKSGGLNPLTEEFKKSGDAIDTEIIAKVRQLKREIDDMASDARNNLASVFSVSTLEQEKRFTESWLEFSRSVKNFSLSGDLRYLLETVAKVQIGGPGTMLGDWMGINYKAGYKAPPQADRPDTFAQRFQPANDNPLKPFSMDDRDRNATLLDLNLYRQRIAILGEAATASERFKLRQLEINAAVAKNAELQPLANRALAAAAAAFKLDAMRANVAALGEAATMTEQYTLRAANLKNQLDQNAISLETYNRATTSQRAELELSLGVADMAAMTEERLRQVREVSAKAGLSDEQARLAVAIATGEARERENQAWRRANPIMAELKDISKDFVTTAAKGFLDAKAGADSLSKAFESLALRLADKALEQFMSGEWEKAAVSAIMAVVSALISLVSHTNDLKGTIEVLDRLNQLRLRQVRANADSNTLAGQLAVFNANAILEQIEEARKGGQLMGALIQVQNEERLVIERDFAKRQIEIEKQAADDRIALAKAIADRQLSFQDRLFAAANDNSTLAGQLAALDRAAQREIIAERDAGGQAMADLEAAQIRERFNLIRDFNNQAIEETRRAEQEKLDLQTRAARAIVDYISGINTGTESSLSPTMRLNAAQSVYNATLGLAQGGNTDALGRVTGDAENLRKALRDVFASGSGFQTGWAQIQQQLLALPAVVTSTDPVVQALLNVQTAINNLRGGATGKTLTDINTALGSGGVLAQDGSLTGVAKDASLTGVAKDASLTGVAKDASLTGVAKDASLTGVAKDASLTGAEGTNAILKILRDNLTGQSLLAGAPAGGFQNTVGPDAANAATNNNVVNALNKIVYNTWAIAANTAQTVRIASVSEERWFGLKAAGGWITGGMPGRDSVPIMAMPDEFMVNANATRALTQQFGAGIMDTINAGRLPANVVPFPTVRGRGDSDSAELREIRKELAETRAVLARLLASGFNAVVRAEAAAADQISEATESGAKRTTFALTQNAKDNKAA